MKKLNLLLIVFFIFTFNSCRALSSKGRSVNRAERLVEQGEYYKSVNVLVNVLQKNPDYIDALDTLKDVYPKALNNKKILVNSLKNSNELIRLAEEQEKILALYSVLRTLKTEVLLYIEQSIDYEKIKFWTNKSAKSYYNAALEKIKYSNSLKDYEEIALLFKKSYEILPTFESSLEKYKEYKEMAMRRILYFIPNYIIASTNLGSYIEKEFRKNIDKTIASNEFINLSSSNIPYSPNDFMNISKKYNRYINISIIAFNYRPPVRSERRYTDYYYEKSYIENNVKYNKIVNSRPKKVEEGVSYKRYSYTKVKNKEDTSVSMTLKYEIYDIENNILLREGFINKEASDFNTWYTYYGHPTKKYDFNKGLKSREQLFYELAIIFGEYLSNKTLNIVL